MDRDDRVKNDDRPTWGEWLNMSEPIRNDVTLFFVVGYFAHLTTIPWLRGLLTIVYFALGIHVLWARIGQRRAHRR